MLCFWKCIGFLAGIGVLSHFVGEALPRKYFHADRAPFKSAKWEKNGRIYDKLHIRRWMNRLPDMSRVMPDMVQKRIKENADGQDIDTLIRETCVAEVTHDGLILCGFVCIFIWKGSGGWIVSLLFAIGNLPFIIIQRYTRPRLCRLYAWMRTREHRKNPNCQVTAEAQPDVQESMVL